MHPDCARCSKPHAASFLIAFTYEDVEYEMTLCSRHSLMFDRDMSAWVNVADKMVPTKTKIAVGISNGGISLLDEQKPGRIRGEISEEAMSYTFTDHALQRMTKRHLSKQDVLAAISSPEKITAPGKNSDWPDAEVWLVDDIKAVVNPKRRRIITVMWRWEEIAKEKSTA